MLRLSPVESQRMYAGVVSAPFIVERISLRVSPARELVSQQ